MQWSRSTSRSGKGTRLGRGASHNVIAPHSSHLPPAPPPRQARRRAVRRACAPIGPRRGRQDHRQGPSPPRVGDRAARPREEGRRRRRGGAAEGEGEARGAMTDRDGTAERRDRVSGLFDAKQHHGHRPAAGARERLARAAWHTCRNVCRVNEPIFSRCPRLAPPLLGWCTAHTLDAARARSG